jgi:hypothetical protein
MRVDARPFSEICHSTEEVYEVSEMHRWKGRMIETFTFYETTLLNHASTGNEIKKED